MKLLTPIKLILLSVSFIFITPLFSQNNDVQIALQNRIEGGLELGGLVVGDVYLYNEDSLTKYYISREYRPVWTDKRNREDCLEVINKSYEHGLIPKDYHLEKIIELHAFINSGKAGSNDYASLDLLMSDAVSLLVNHLNFGKVSQSKLRSSWDLPPNPMPNNPTDEFDVAIENNTLADFFEGFGPQHFMYKHLKNGLRIYRQIETDGGWTQIPEGETLKKDMTDSRISLIRDRLFITGDLESKDATEPSTFDEELEAAVKVFQFRNNLNQDGAIGKKTLAMMNVPVEDRIDQIRINLERTRWIMHELEEDFLVVNIAGFNIRRVQHDETVYMSPVIVGRPYHQSPIFKSTMQYFVINPTWTVPYSIATKETLPKLQKNPNYLAEHNMIIMDRSGKKLDPSTINFENYSRSNFPFTVRQEPGPHNALGEVKFIFPNPYSVYVHDTPARSLFSREERAFSHGCIRLQKKWELLFSLTDNPEVWNMDKVNEVLASEKTTTVHFKNPIDILILYWTAGADKQDNIYFNEDIYKRDASVLKALDQPHEFKKVK